MYISKYVKLISQSDKYYVYNSLTNFFAEIDGYFWKYLHRKQESKNTVSKERIGEDIWNKFCFKRIFTESNEDDILLYASTIKAHRRISNILLLTIAPTMDCNFSCPYCFETKEKGIMSNQLIKNLIDWIVKYKNIEQIKITWFGGEPLLAPQIINKITQGIKNSSSVDIHADIITNGYYLTEENIQLLELCNVEFIQLSIDGLYDTHNSKRFTKTDKNTFDTILKNIDTFHRLRPNIKMTIRVSVDKDNMTEYPHIHQFFMERYMGNENIMIIPAFIIETTKSCMKSCIIDELEKYKFYEQFTLLTGSRYFTYPYNPISECAIRNNNTWAIDAQGGLYKCWEILGNKAYRVGKLKKQGVEITNITMINRYLYGADPFEDDDCKKCFSLPICGGGCPHRRIENKFNGKDFNVCIHFKDNLEKYLLLRAQLPNEPTEPPKNKKNEKNEKKK
jgi:uncharacterized protein